VGGETSIGSCMSASPPSWSKSFRPVGIGWLKMMGIVGRVMSFHSFSHRRRGDASSSPHRVHHGFPNRKSR